MLDRLRPKSGARRPRKRVGRGPGGAGGKTAGRGIKGQGKRSPGREVAFHFEGGQLSLVRRLPKRGFYNRERKRLHVLNLAALAPFGDGATIDAEALAARGLIGKAQGDVKLLGEGEPPRNITVKVQRLSASARRKIEAAGGTVEIV